MKLRQLVNENGFSFSVYQLAEEGGGSVADIPVVGGWLQLNIQLLQVPPLDLQKLFFGRVKRLASALHAFDASAGWYFLHKPPGLLLRFETGNFAEAFIPELVAELNEWNWDWMGALCFDSYFEQKHLLGGYHREDINALLRLSAEHYMEALARDDNAGLEQWATFMRGFFHHYLQDAWFSWEALCRLESLRKRDFRPGGEPLHTALYNPDSLLAGLPGLRPTATGFAASTSLLQALNYMLNQWALPAGVQLAVLRLAKRQCRPGILPPEGAEADGDADADPGNNRGELS